MGKPKPKWYVVLKGQVPGIYTLWEDTQKQIQGFAGAVYKSFESQAEAELAWKNKGWPKSNTSPVSGQNATSKRKTKPPAGPFVIVDASSRGVPGPAEYQGFLMPDRKPLFSMDIGFANNNLGEFLGIVHALALMYKQESNLPVYSDSTTAMSWVRHKKVKSELPRTPKTQTAWDLVDRALIWLNTHTYRNPVLKWETESWGENPADYGRK